MSRISRTNSKSDPDKLPLKIRGLPPIAYFAKNGGAVMTFGVFDGVNRAHLAILRKVSARAEAVQAPSAVVVFRPRPIDAWVIRPPEKYLTAENETVHIIKSAGITHVGVLRFNRDLAATTASHFLRRLVLRIRIRELWLGARATIGRGPEGSASSVRRICEELGFKAELFEPEEKLPSIRTVLEDFEARDIGAVTHDLGRRFMLSAYVAKGLPLSERGLVRFALLTPDLLYVPPDGEYAVVVHPASFGNDRPGPKTVSGSGVLLIKTHRQLGSKPELFLIGDADLGWSDSFVRLEFFHAFATPPLQLWEWATRECKAVMCPGASVESVRTASAGAGAPVQKPLPRSQP
jgi:FAD synthase